MNTDRIKTLTSYYAEDPSDPFNIYALAIEYMSGDVNEASHWFDKLLQEHPKYLPAYYQAARCHDIRHQKEEAIKTLEKGIALAAELRENKTRSELMSYLDELTFD